ncbi:MAG: DUF3105 domain-containing protein, partial [Micromonosporaceae bacterium]
GPAPRLAWWAVVAALVLGVLAVLAAGPYRFLIGNATGSTAEPPRDAPCLPGEAVAIMDSPHISEAEADSVRYNSLPPTSGPHYAFTIATGVYDEPIDEGLTVHAMEHGHVVIQYAPTTAEREVADLRRLARRYGADVILAPYPPLTDGIALTAWGRLELLDTYDEERIVAFVEALRGRYRHGWTSDDDCAEATR